MPKEFYIEDKTGRLALFDVDVDKGTYKEIPYTHPQPIPKGLQPGPELETGYFTSQDIYNPLARSFANIIPSLSKNIAEGITGLPEVIPNIVKLGAKLLPFSTDRDRMEGLRTLGNIGRGLAEPYSSQENLLSTIVDNPGLPASQIFDIATALMKGPGLGSTLGTIGKAVATPRSTYAAWKLGRAIEKNLPELQASKVIPNLGTTPVNTPQLAQIAKNFGINLTPGQILGNASVAGSEAAATEALEKILVSQGKISSEVLQDILKGTRPTGAKPVTFTTPTSTITDELSRVAKVGYKRELDRLNGELAKWNESLGLKTDNKSTLIIKKAIDKGIKKGYLDSSTLDRFNELKSNITDFRKITGVEESNVLTKSQSFLKPTTEVRNIQPFLVNEKIASKALSTNENFQRFMSQPGITDKHAQQLLVHQMVNQGIKPNGTFNLKYPAEFIREHASKFNAAFQGKDSRSALTALRSMTHILEKIDIHSQTSPLKIISGTGGQAELQLVAALSPAFYGGQILKGRAGVGTAYLINMAIRGPFVGKALLNKDMAWIVNRILRTPKTDPALPALAKRFLKIAGQSGVAVTVTDPKEGTEIELKPED